MYELAEKLIEQLKIIYAPHLIFSVAGHAHSAMVRIVRPDGMRPGGIIWILKVNANCERLKACQMINAMMDCERDS